MAGSQLKRLKASLAAKGIIGPQQSKKQKKRHAQARANGNSKGADLQQIRESFNPFDLKHNVRGPKFPVTSNRPATGDAAKGIYGRPTDAKAVGEERRRQTLLSEIQNRSKTGGLVDRRFGEDDASMTPEEKMLQRFAREKQQSLGHKKSGMFDLEDDGDEEGFGLTHMGKSLSLDGPALVDDYDETAGSDAGSLDEGQRAYLKRKQLTAEFPVADSEVEEEEPARKKTKKEVMEELIAKSKSFKYARQEAKEQDEELREELDKELQNIHSLLYTKRKDVETPASDSKEAIAAAEKDKFEREFDLKVKRLAAERRAQPTERTKTEEEVAAEESARLKELEEKRIRRMNGEVGSDEEDDTAAAAEEGAQPSSGPIQFQENEEEDWGLGKGIRTKGGITAAELGGDEDDFLLEDIIASGSEISPAEDESSDDDGSEADDYDDDDLEEEDEDDFIKGLLNDEEAKNPVFSMKLGGPPSEVDHGGDVNGIPFTFECPQSHEDLVTITSKIPAEKLVTVVQRIRALYHPKLDSANKTKLANFSKVLVQHLAFLASLPAPPSFAVLENLIRHIHSLSKSFPIEVANEFRSQIDTFGRKRPLSPTVGDLISLTAIGTIFPTSDHFHQVVTPAMLVMARYLGQKVPQEVADYAAGSYLSILALQYQKDSKRFVPELLNFSLNTLCSLSPTKPEFTTVFPLHTPKPGFRISGARNVEVRKLTCADCTERDTSKDDALGAKVAIFDTTLKVIEAAIDTWIGKPAFIETFEPALQVFAHLAIKSCRSEIPEVLGESLAKVTAKLERTTKLARLSRKPLELHHHRPLAVKSNIPKFEDSFDPNKHYDPDRDRAEMAKLKKEHKNERKSAMRELRKDANFTAREKLRIKKAKDEAYEKKYRRLVAEIQGEEGREANAYDREKMQRKRAGKAAR